MNRITWYGKDVSLARQNLTEDRSGPLLADMTMLNPMQCRVTDAEHSNIDYHNVDIFIVQRLQVLLA